jgi:hypothetical protein
MPWIGHKLIPMYEHAVALAGVSFRLESRSLRAIQAAREHFTGFESDGGDWRVTIEEADPRLSGELALDVDAERKTAVARVGALPTFFPPGSVQNMLRLLLIHDLAPKGGLLLHASSLAVGGAARAFFGKSGAGKSTLARTFPDGTLLSDEITIITGDGRAHRAPFTGEQLPPKMPLAAPLRALFAIAHGETFVATRLSPAEALRRLLPCVLNVGHDRGSSLQLIDNAAAICARVPIYAATFPLGASSQPWIDM